MTNTTNAALPEYVVARYLTIGSAPVDIAEDTDARVTAAACLGCHADHHVEWSSLRNELARADALDAVRPWAQSHAETCRAMPLPTA